MIFFPGKLAEEVGEAIIFLAKMEGGLKLCVSNGMIHILDRSPRQRKRWMAKPPSLVGKGIPT